MGAVQGNVEPRFEAVRDLLEQQFAQGQHIGASVAVYHHGRLVADVWGGLADQDTGTPWDADTMAVSFSTTKGLTATCLHILADRGLVDYQAPVATYWPEFAQNGKEKITVYHLLTHQAGLPQVPDSITAEDQYADWDRMVDAIAAEAPLWEPGAETGYHALTFGYLVGEVVRRVSGKSVGTFFRDEVAVPLGITDLYIGAPESVEPRIATLRSTIVMDEATRVMGEQFRAANPLLVRAMPQLGTQEDTMFFNTRIAHAAEIPAAGGVMGARGLARLYACLANYGELDGVRIMSAERVRVMSERQTYRADKVIIVPVGWSLGYMNGGSEGWPQGPRVTAFGHAGFGGSIGFADPEIEMSFALTLNALALDLIGYGRTAALAAAARSCAEAA